MEIVVVGFGWVGQANALSLALMGEKVNWYDPASPNEHYKEKYAATYKQLTRLNTVLAKDTPETVYIVCVGDKVDPDGVQDISLIEKALSSLKGCKGTVVLRSTIIPHTLSKLAFDFYVPEFLHEKKAVEESVAPHYFVVGARTKKPEPEFFKAWEKNAYKTFRGTPEEASYIKYLSNLWNSVRIGFVNEFGNAVRPPNSAADVAAIERIIDFVFDGKFYMRYGRPFGGHCLPKDTRAFVRAHKDMGREVPLLENLYKSNEIHERISNNKPHLKEWFSAWSRPMVSGRVAFQHLIDAGNRRIDRVVKRVTGAGNV